MDYKLLLSTFGRNAFEEFCYLLIDNFYEDPWKLERKRIDDFCIFNKYFDDRFGCEDRNYLCYYFPTKLLYTDSFAKRDLNDIINLVGKIISTSSYSQRMWLPVDWGARSFYLLTNITNFSKSDTSKIAEIFSEKMSNSYSSPIYQFGFGSIDTFLSQQKSSVSKTMQSFLENYSDGIIINLNRERAHILNYYSLQDYYVAGKESSIECSPIITYPNIQSLFVEFEKLINSDCSEKNLEDFLKSNYKIIFGKEYNHIETQIALYFPEFDIDKRNRRMDICLSNSFTEGLEVYELKKSNIDIFTSSTGVPSPSKSVTKAIAQILNYRDIIQKDRVKDFLYNKGFYCDNVSFNVIIGKQPNISPQKWAFLKKEFPTDVRVITYDELLQNSVKMATIYKSF